MCELDVLGLFVCILEGNFHILFRSRHVFKFHKINYNNLMWMVQGFLYGKLLKISTLMGDMPGACFAWWNTICTQHHNQTLLCILEVFDLYKTFKFQATLHHSHEVRNLFVQQGSFGRFGFIFILHNSKKSLEVQFLFYTSVVSGHWCYYG